MERNIRNNIIEISDITYMSELTLDIFLQFISQKKMSRVKFARSRKKFRGDWFTQGKALRKPSAHLKWE